MIRIVKADISFIPNNYCSTVRVQPQDPAPSEYIEIASDGWYKIDFTALLEKASDGRIIRADVYKVSSKDPSQSCAAAAGGESCEVALQLRLITRVSLKVRQ